MYLHRILCLSIILLLTLCYNCNLHFLSVSPDCRLLDGNNYTSLPPMVFAPRYCQVWFCCCCSVTKLCPTLCDPVDCSMPGSLSLIISWSLPKFTSVESVMSSNHLTLCQPLLLLPSIFPHIRVFSNESAVHIRWPTYWSFIFSISPFNEYSGLISFKINCFDLLAVQRTLKSLLQYHSSKASILSVVSVQSVQLLSCV